MNARIIYFAVCMAVVIGILVAIIGGTGLSQKMQDPNFKNAAKNPNAYTEICNQADYNETCIAALQSQLGQNTNATFQDIFMVSVKMTQESLNQNIDLASNMKNGSDPTSRAYMALDDCVQLLNSSIFDLQGVINLLNGSSNNSILNDDQRFELKNLASSAISFQQACIDGIEDVEHKRAIEGGMVNATRYCSNILAFADAHIGNVSLSPRKLLTDDDDGDFGYPSWLPVADRKLLASSEGNGEVKPDVVVAQDGSGQFDTISKALDSYDPNQHQGSRYVIYVKSGKYNETVTVAENKVNVFIYGDGPAKTVVTGHRSNKEGYTTLRTATFFVLGKGFVAKNMGFQNTAGPEAMNAVALCVQADMSAFFNCRIEGYQGSLYALAHRQFYRECIILGTTDFIFGDSSTVIQSSSIIVKQPLSNQSLTITAQGRSAKHEMTGFVIQGCQIYRVKQPLFGKAYLGRAAKAYSRTIIMESELGGFIHPEGWMLQNVTFNPQGFYYAEYGNKGRGADTSKRFKHEGCKVITDKTEALQFTAGPFIQGHLWLNSTGEPALLGLQY